MDKFQELLREYAHTVKMKEYWKNHGTWGDGRLEMAKKDRAAAKRNLTRYVNKCLANQVEGV